MNNKEILTSEDKLQRVVIKFLRDNIYWTNSKLNKIERVNNYISFILFTPCINDFPEINKNTYIEIRGEILGNSNKNEEIDDCLVIFPKTIRKGVKI